MAIFKPLRKDGSRAEQYVLQFRFDGKEYQRRTHTADKRTAQRMEREQKRMVREGKAADFLAALDGLRTRRRCCTIGEICAAYLDEGVRLIESETQRKRNVNDLRLVLAWGMDLWTEHRGGIRGIKIGEEVPDVARIDALAASVLTRGLVREYFRARHGGTLDVAAAADENKSINSTFRHARSVFSARAMSYKLEGLALPDLSGFMKESLLPEVSVEPDPVKAPEFAAMLTAAAALDDSELALVNRIFRQTGLRSGSVEHLHSDWLEHMQDGWWIQVKVRKGRTAQYSIPISDELAAIIRERAGFTILPTGTAAERHDLVHGRHNTWLKGIIGGAGEKGQGNHRLRDTVGSILKSWLGMDVAVEALGHADARTTRKHYAKLRMDVSEVMKTELAPFTRLRPAGKVVEFRAAI